jgi:hypothetical protein
MFIIRDTSNQIVAITTRLEDAKAMTHRADFDKETYTIEKTSN